MRTPPNPPSIPLPVVQVWNYKLRRCLFTLLGHLDYIRTTFFHHVSSAPPCPRAGAEGIPLSSSAGEVVPDSLVLL